MSNSHANSKADGESSPGVSLCTAAETSGQFLQPNHRPFKLRKEHCDWLPAETNGNEAEEEHVACRFTCPVDSEQLYKLMMFNDEVRRKVNNTL